MSLSFRIVQLFKDRTLGSSESHGTVCQAKCDGVHCVAKIINGGCYSPVAEHKSTYRKDRLVPAFKRLEQEVEFLCTISHPSLVQYLGVHRDHATGFPVILMEMMNYNLSAFLESSNQPLSYHQKAGICYDVAQGLSFLHSYSIVHRYLSSNNVLLNMELKAKIGDFGTSKLVSMGLQASSRNPRVSVYMPPESVAVPPQYSEKSDCFSFGVLIIQILTCHFPSPTDRSLAETEVERYEYHINMVDPNHPLLPTALCCLRDNASDRPSAQELCERIASVKGNDYDEATHVQPSSDGTSIGLSEGEVVGDIQSSSCGEDIWLSWSDSSLELKKKDEVITNLRQQIKELKLQLKDVSENHRKEIVQKNWMITENEIRLGEVNQRLEKSEEARASLERQSLAFENWAKQSSATSTVESKRKIKLEWGEEICSPYRRNFSRFSSNAVVEGDMVLFKTALTPEIYAFDSAEGSWSQVPSCLHVNGYCSLTIVNGLVTTVGDYDYGGNYSNRLYSLVAQDHQWRKAFPNMPTKRCLATALCTGTALIVAGGRGQDRVVTETVEVMNTKSCRWLSAADLPEPLFCSSAAVCGDRIYLAGGKDRHGLSIPTVYTCSVSALLKSCKSRLFRTRHPLLSDPTFPTADQPSIWRRIADLPVVGSTCVSVNGQLVAVGGRELNHSATTAIHVYYSSSDSWIPLDQRMSTPRSECYAAVLPYNRLLIAGGYVADSNLASTVEIARIL